MFTFKDYCLKEEQDYKDYLSAVSLYEQEARRILEEGILDSISGAIKEKLDFIKELATISKMKLEDLVILFKNIKAYAFFKEIKFNLKKLWELLKAGYYAYDILHDKISGYASKNKIVYWTTEELKKLQAWLDAHPAIKKLFGVGLAGLLLYLWFNVGSTGNIDYDFDFSSILHALKGHFNLEDIFGGANGIKLLMVIVTGAIGLGFPFPSPTNVNFIIALLYTLGKQFNLKQYAHIPTEIKSEILSKMKYAKF